MFNETETIMREIISQMQYKIKEFTHTGNEQEYYIIEKDEDINRMAGKLHGLILRDVKAQYDSIEYTSTKENTLTVMSDEGLAYEFQAFYGDRCGGSEWEETYKLSLTCKDTGVKAVLLNNSVYSR